jgi:hypothetical protein
MSNSHGDNLSACFAIDTGRAQVGHIFDQVDNQHDRPAYAGYVDPDGCGAASKSGAETRTIAVAIISQ